MLDPIFSPDGNWMWTGSEWIPAPPNDAPSEIDASFDNEMVSVEAQDSIFVSNENISSSISVDVHRNKTVYVFVALIVLIGITIAVYFLLFHPSSPEPPATPAIVGTWETWSDGAMYDEGGGFNDTVDKYEQIRFFEDGTLTHTNMNESMDKEWVISDSSLTIEISWMVNFDHKYSYYIDGDTMFISAGDENNSCWGYVRGGLVHTKSHWFDVIQEPELPNFCNYVRPE